MQMFFNKKTEKRAKEIRADTSQNETEIQEPNDIDDKAIMKEIIDYLLYTPDTSSELIAAGSGNRKSRDLIMQRARNLLNYKFLHRKVSEIRLKSILDKMEKFLWGYHVLEELIEDTDISDIRVMNYNNVSACYNGVYKKTKVCFSSEEEFHSFMQSLAIMNRLSLADNNALSVVTDKNSNQNWILRIAIATAYVNSEETYFLHIRKHPKAKRTFDDLQKIYKMIPNEVSEYLKGRINKGLFVTGPTGGGKTHFLNSMIDLIPENIPGTCVQESEELFSSKDDSLINFLHVVMKKGEGKIKYDLEDLSKFGLLTSNVYFINGEIKGAEAAYFANCCYTGFITWTTGHGESSEDAIDKLVEYVIRVTGYDVSFVRKMLKSLGTIVFISGYKIMEIKEIVGYDDDKGDLLYKTIYRREQG